MILTDESPCRVCYDAITAEAAMRSRPVSITILGLVYIVMGTVGFLYHLTEFNSRQPFPSDFVWIEIVRLIAIVCGVFLLQQHNWARWLALAWIAFHVVLSAFHTPAEFAVHCLFCAIVAYLLFRQPAVRYFRPARP